MKRNLQETLGLTPNESKIYEVLIKGIEPDVPTLVTETGLPRTRIYEVLSSLSAKNLVEKRSSGGYRFIPPSESIEFVLDQIDREYQNKRGSIKEMGNFLDQIWNQNLQSELSPGVAMYNIEDAQSLFLNDIASVTDRLWIAAADTNTSIDMQKSGRALAAVFKPHMDIRYLASDKNISNQISSRLSRFPPFLKMNINYRFNENLHASFVLIDSLLYLFFFGGEEILQATTLRTTSNHLAKSFEWMYRELWRQAGDD